jgi:hypothetical protein
MARLSPKLRSVADNHVAYWCQGCEGVHSIRVNAEGKPSWTWDGNVDAPTFSPSVLVTYSGTDAGEDDAPPEVCHTFINAGMVQFLGDCTHQFAGQTLPLPDWPYAEGEYGGV